MIHRNAGLGKRFFCNILYQNVLLTYKDRSITRKDFK